MPVFVDLTPSTAGQPHFAAISAAGTVHFLPGEVRFPGYTLRFPGARFAMPLPEEPLGGLIHFLQGNDPSNWRTNLSHFTRLRYSSLYPGIDLVFHATAGELEYDFEISPHADPSLIRLHFSGARRLALLPDGALALHTRHATATQRPPVASQPGGSPVPARYRLLSRDTATFQLGPYNPPPPPPHDPVITGTYLGGSADDRAFGIATDLDGNVYVAGVTASPNFPTASPRQAAFAGGGADAFVAKFDPTLSRLIFCTFLGGSGADQANRIAVDASGNAYVFGLTNSPNFPLAGALQSSVRGVNDLFISKLSPDGQTLLYSTLLGGGGQENAYAITLDRLGQAIVTGTTTSQDFPTTPGAYDSSFNGVGDAFLAKLNPSGNALAFSTYFGGIDNDIARAVAVARNGSLYLAGEGGRNLPTTPGAPQPNWRGRFDAFLARFSSDGARLEFCTYQGGAENENVGGLVYGFDGTNDLIAFGGVTASSDLPVTLPKAAAAPPRTTAADAASVAPPQAGPPNGCAGTGNRAWAAYMTLDSARTERFSDCYGSTTSTVLELGGEIGHPIIKDRLWIWGEYTDSAGNARSGVRAIDPSNPSSFSTESLGATAVINNAVPFADRLYASGSTQQPVVAIGPRSLYALPNTFPEGLVFSHTAPTTGNSQLERLLALNPLEPSPQWRPNGTDHTAAIHFIQNWHGPDYYHRPRPSQRFFFSGGSIPSDRLRDSTLKQGNAAQSYPCVAPPCYNWPWTPFGSGPAGTLTTPGANKSFFSLAPQPGGLVAIVPAAEQFTLNLQATGPAAELPTSIQVNLTGPGDYSQSLTVPILPPGNTTVSTLAVTNAASFERGASPDSLVTAFFPSTGLPAPLYGDCRNPAGFPYQIRFNPRGVDINAGICNMTATQSTFYLPPDTPTGPLTISLINTDTNQVAASGVVNVTPQNPGLFKAGGLPAGFFVGVNEAGEQRRGNLITVGSSGTLVLADLNWQSGEKMFIGLYATGYSGQPTVRVGNEQATVNYYGNDIAPGLLLIQFEVPQEARGLGLQDVLLERLGSTATASLGF